MRSARSEQGFFFLPIVLFLAIGMSAAFLLIPSFDREQILEGQRVRHEQARAAAEGAAELALARGEDVPEMKIGRALCTATWIDERTVKAEARVPSLRKAFVQFEVTRISPSARPR